ncbi:MAG TPA: aminoglycoside phosphotransferase family protein [Miltoncostaeaceae bacterium]|nr:aminoglycoside phosphotransferase family protein [Miltoncostaeaceae bacterium]
MAERFTVVVGDDGAPWVEKRGDPAALAREAAALAVVAGRAWAPALLRHEPGLLVTARVPGGPRDLAVLGAAEARRLGAVLREVHHTRRAAAGGLWWWRAPARDLAAYREGRVRDAEAALAGTPDAGLARRRAGAPPPRDGGFAFLHGDLVAPNVLWPPRGGPVLIDWEFHRMGDPAEDLAYLAELNALPDAVLAEVLDGYGAPDLVDRVEGWRGLAAADAGGWFRAQGMHDEAERMLARARGRAAPG